MGKNTIICSGCSFTWGQGLWYYLDTGEFVPINEDYIWDVHPIPDSGNLLRESLRWPKLVSNYFNLKEIVKPHNGGTDEESIRFIEYLLDDDKTNIFNFHFGNVKTNVNECKWIIFQTTQAYRTPFDFVFKNTEYRLRSEPNLKNLSILEKKIEKSDDYYPYEVLSSFTPFYDWLYENNYRIEDFEKIHKNYIVNRIESILKKYNSFGINVAIWSWTDEYLEIFKENKFISDRFIKFKCNGVTYDCLDDLQLKHRELTIKYDSSTLHNTGEDYHPSKKCHQLIATHIIEYIRKHG